MTAKSGVRMRSVSEILASLHPEWQSMCPVCKAPIGAGCRTPEGYPRTSHKKRKPS